MTDTETRFGPCCVTGDVMTDSGVHRLREEADANRDAWLAEAGWGEGEFDPGQGGRGRDDGARFPG